MLAGASVSGAVVAFARSLTLAHVPTAVVERTTRLLADTLGCALAAGRAPLARQLADYARGRASTGDGMATLLVGGGRTDLALAALANTAAVRLLDANDLYCPLPEGYTGGHFSDALPALLGAAEVAGSNGAEVVAAVVAAYEVQALLAEAVDWRAGGWHTDTLVTWALPGALARLARRPPTQALAALSLAGTTGQALQSWLRPDLPVTALKSVAPGLCAQRAVEAVELASIGITAPPDALETMLRQLGCDPAAVPVGRLGHEWTVGRNLVKRYPAQYLTQGAVAAALALHRDGLDASRLVEITVYGHSGVCAGVQGAARAYHPQSHEDADHSTPFVVALALLRGRLAPADYDGAPWDSPQVQGLMARVRLVVEPAREEAYRQRGMLGCRLVARDLDGREWQAEVAQPPGHPANPLTDSALAGKLDELLAGALGPDGGQRLLAACTALPAAPNLAPLLTLLREGSQATSPAAER